MADDYKITIVLEGDNKLSQTVRVAGGDLRRFADDTRNAANQTGMFERQTRSMTDTLRTFAGGVLGGLALREVVNFAESMNELGTEVNANRILFEQLTGTLGGSTAVLRDLRAATGDVVDDMTLMAGANQLLRLGITETSDQTADLIGMIQRLKQPTESTTDAIQNFALMLSNESLLRLDSFGISSANVKRRMDELGQSFREATMAEMAGQIERLGDAADVAITPLARIQTIIENIKEIAGANINTGVNSLAGFMLALYDVSQANYDLVSRAQQVMQQANLPQSNTLQLPFMNLVSTDRADAEVAARATVRWFDELAATINRAVNPLREWTAAQREARLEQQRLIDGISSQRGLDSFFSQIDANLGRINALTGGVAFPQYMTQSDASQIKFQAEQIAAAAEAAKDQFKDLLSDADLADLQHAVDISKELASAAQKSADAFSKITLSQLFGQTSGGIAGQIEDRILASLQGAIPDSELQALQQRLDLQTGRETNASMSFANDVLPLFQSIYQQGGAGDVITAMDNLTHQLETYALSGTPLPADLSGLTGFRAAGSGITINVVPGDNLYSLAGRYGGGIEDYRSLLNAQGILLTGQYGMGGAEPIPGFNVDAIQGLNMTLGDISAQADVALDPMVTASESVVSTFEGVQSILDDITGSVHKVTIDLDVRIPAILEWLFNQSGTDWMKNIITANGGVPPGSDTRGAGGGGSLR